MELFDGIEARRPLSLAFFIAFLTDMNFLPGHLYNGSFLGSVVFILLVRPVLRYVSLMFLTLLYLNPNCLEICMSSHLMVIA